MKNIYIIALNALAILFATSCSNSSNQKKSMEPNNTNIEQVNLNDIFILPPKLDTDASVTSFETWLEKQEKQSAPDDSQMVCFIKLMYIKWMPACYLVLSKPHELDKSMLKASLVVGGAYAWPAKDSHMSEKDIEAMVESAFLKFIKRPDRNPHSIFLRCAKVAIGFKNNDYSVVEFNK